jgi:hypothetical protein
MGLGIDSCGRFECGGAKSDIEPRFYFSHPLDKSKNNNVDVFLKFETYCFSSFIELDALTVTISENNGMTFNPAYVAGSFVAPYNGTESKVRHSSPQMLAFWIQKTADWPVRTKIMINVSGMDDFGNEVSKTVPVTWS